MLIMIRTEYDRSIIVIRMVSMFFLTKSRSHPKAPIRDLPIFSGLYSIEGISSQAKHMPGLSSHCEIAFVRQLLTFHYRFSIFLIFENWTREAVWMEVSNFPQSVGIFTHPPFTFVVPLVSASFWEYISVVPPASIQNIILNQPKRREQ